MQINYSLYGKEVRNIRKSMKLTQEDVYNHTGISIETLRRLEKGVQEPKISTLEKLSHYYKFDLVSLLKHCRSKRSFLSEEIIHSINHDLINCDYESLKATISLLMNDFLRKANSTCHQEAIKYLTRYLDTFNKIDFSKYNDLSKNIINVEKFLLFLNRNNTGIGSDIYLYDLEVSSIIYLIALYRQNANFQEAIKLSYEVIDKIKHYPYHSKIQLNHLGALYLNLAYVYHRIDNHEKVIEIVDEALHNTNIIFTNHLYNELVVRKAFALYFLENDDYMDLITSVLYNTSPSHKKTVCKVLYNKYSIKHKLCVNIE